MVATPGGAGASDARARTNPGRNILLLTGGTWHDFEGFGRHVRELVEGTGARVDSTSDADALLTLNERACDLVVLYTCQGNSRQGDITGRDPHPAQVAALGAWVRAGGGLLAVHGATVMGDARDDLFQLLGGRFVSHPEPFSYTVDPVADRHPVTDGIGAFEIVDEFYTLKTRPDVRILMTALHDDVRHPMVWCRREGRGNVVYVAPGHDQRVWTRQPWRTLMKQAVEFLTSSGMKDEG